MICQRMSKSMFSEGNIDNQKPEIEIEMMRLKDRGKIAFGGGWGARAF